MYAATNKGMESKMTLTLIQRIELAAELIKRARVYYDIWWFFNSNDTRPRISKTIKRYSEFFRFDSHAHFVSMVIYLYGLFETRHNTINFTSIAADAASSGYKPEIIKTIRGLIIDNKALTSKLAIIRSHLFAHRSSRFSYTEVFRKAGITPFQFRDLTDTGLQIANLLLSAYGHPEQSFHEWPLKHTKDLLKDLSQIQS